MKKILIIGKDNYIGRHLKDHLLHYGGEFIINLISSNTETWKVLNFKIYDCVIYLAEADTECDENEYEIQNQYYNGEFLLNIAQEAKRCAVKRFIYFSTIDIYGASMKLGETSTIDKNSMPDPKTSYACAKFKGEQLLKELEDKKFKIITLRLPFLYGPGCPGIYAKMTDMLLSNSKIPYINNQLSVINIETLCAFTKYLLNNDYYGTFHPQNKSYMSTCDLFKNISKELLTPLKLSKYQGWKYNTFKDSCPDTFKNLFGTLIYSKDIDL